MSLSSEFQASGPLPSATFSGWDAQTKQLALWADAASGGGGGGSAVGPAGAVQYSDGAGNFQGSANCVVDATGNLYADASIESGGTLISAGGLNVGAGATIAGEIIGGANVTQTDTNAIATLSLVKARTLSLLLPSAVPGASMLNPVRGGAYALNGAFNPSFNPPNTPLNSSSPTGFKSIPTLMPSQGGWVVPGNSVGYPLGAQGTGYAFVVYNSDWNPDNDMLIVTPLSASLGSSGGNEARCPITCSVIKDPNGQAGGFLIIYNATNTASSGNGSSGAPFTSINGVVPSGANGTFIWPWWAWDGPNQVNGTPATGNSCPVFLVRLIKGHT